MKLQSKMFVIYFISSVVYLKVKASIIFCFGNYGSDQSLLKYIVAD